MSKKQIKSGVKKKNVLWLEKNKFLPQIRHRVAIENRKDYEDHIMYRIHNATKMRQLLIERDLYELVPLVQVYRTYELVPLVRTPILIVSRYFPVFAPQIILQVMAEIDMPLQHRELFNPPTTEHWRYLK